MKLAVTLTLALMVCGFVASAHADPITVAPDDTIAKIVASQTGKTVTLMLGGSDEVTGKVKSASPEVVHLTELSGKEFYDAAVATKSITAVVVRVR